MTESKWKRLLVIGVWLLAILRCVQIILQSLRYKVIRQDIENRWKDAISTMEDSNG